MFPVERHKKIVEILNREGQIRVSDIQRTFNIGYETAKKDLQELENKGIITRIHGGAILNDTIQDGLQLKTEFESLDCDSNIQNKILSVVRMKGEVKLSDLQVILNIDSNTLMKHSTKLAESGLIAMMVCGTTYYLSVDNISLAPIRNYNLYLNRAYHKTKLCINIDNGHLVYVDYNELTIMIASQIKSNCRFITHSLKCALVLGKLEYEVTLFGGKINNNGEVIFNGFASGYSEKFDDAIIYCEMYVENDGFYTSSQQRAEYLKSVIEYSKRIVCVTDNICLSHKFLVAKHDVISEIIEV
ncbi:MAG: DeoR family transcriptional regulator [Lachnospiraceae bacterium]|uniref:DeoR family transcriptional regulator n=1 Tax=uncultured Acetatifactor sp. TaxID=1671927 RepID=UPI00261151A4|nr:DeoR family transcriptional regulator [uncultured Acetatifactor sp.]MCI8788983.1 DeoR family transcriptional regulator [Lachnospiraceae bacterium]